MPRTCRALLVAGLLTVFSVGVAAANIPDPGLSDVPNVIATPLASLSYVVTVNGPLGPVAGATVDLVFSGAADALVCWCAGTSHPVISAVTNAGGQATFNIAGGGCVDPARLGGTVVEVFADGIKLSEVGLVSPDAVDSGGVLPTSGWVVGPPCSVGLSDATFHTGPISSGVYEFCTDVDSDGVVALADAVLLTAPITVGETCP